MTDPRVQQARDLLAASSPYPVLQREAAELRRVLAQLLTLVDDYEVEEREHDVTGLTAGGGAKISPADVLVLVSALGDAIAHCSEHADGACADCEAHPAGLCYIGAAQEDMCDAYAALGTELGIEGDL